MLSRVSNIHIIINVHVKKLFNMGVCAPEPYCNTLFYIFITYNANVLIMDFHLVFLIFIDIFDIIGIHVDENYH